MQAFGYMVEEEVAVAAVTNYEVTLFMQRPADGTDKQYTLVSPFGMTKPGHPQEPLGYSSCKRPNGAIQVLFRPGIVRGVANASQ